MKTIYKYPLRLVDTQQVMMPEGARILTVQMQHEVPTLWALVESTVTPKPRTVCIVGTGHPASEVVRMDYVGTVQEHCGALVWHVFTEPV